MERTAKNTSHTLTKVRSMQKERATQYAHVNFCQRLIS